MIKLKTTSIAIATAFIALPAFCAELTVVKGDDEGTYKLQGSNTSVGLYGFVELDVMKNFQANTSGDWSYDAGSIGIANDPSGVNSDARKGVLNMTAQTSRVGFKSVTNAEVGTIRTKLEGDYVGGKLRLRHAYGEIKSGSNVFLAGQTWDLFADLDAAPETLDFGGPGGIALNRPQQVRFTTDLGAAGSLAAAVQMPSNSLASDAITKSPALTGAWSINTKPAYVALHGLVNPVSYETSTGASQTKYGYGVSLAGTAKLGGSDTVLLTLTHGKGISQYVNAANYNKEMVNAAGDIVLNKVSAATVGLAHIWNAKVRSNVSYSYTKLGDEYAQATAAAANKKVSSAFLNTIWTVASNTELGAEFLYGERELSNGTSGKTSRVQGSFHYNF